MNTLDMDVVVCAKNQAKTMDQVLHQIVRDIPFKNLIVVYGPSTDNTRETAEQHTDKVFYDGDKGLGAARSLGIKKASSEIVAMIDSDIILTKGWYHQLIGHLQDPKVAAVMGTCVYGYGYKPLQSYWEYQRRTAKTNYGCQNTMFRREAVLKVGNFNETIRGAGEDYDLYSRLLAAGYKWVWVREASVYHPMTMREYLKHVRWWTQGAPYTEEVAKWAQTTSVLRVYVRQFFFMLESFRTAVKLAVVVHPTFLLYWPLIRMTFVSQVLRELKKARVGRLGANQESPV